LAEVNVFSFHPVKHITTGEGGMITTDDAELARRMRAFRNHGISTDHHQRAARGSWFYEMEDLGFNYRLTDIQCSLGISQLNKFPKWVARRRQIAERYTRAFDENPAVRPLALKKHVAHSYHLYVIQLNDDWAEGRARVFSSLRDKGIGVNVHYLPVHLHPFYKNRYGTDRGLCPNAEKAYDKIISLPIFPAMKESMVETVINAVHEVIAI
jgi:perosamine synthetase